jgi:peptidoglycan/LPS O-acetylase OafA/YrhL
MVMLGEASYSLYIIHWSAITFIRMGYLGPYGGPAVHAVVLMATVGLSVLVYRFIEVPWRRRLRGTPAHDESMPVPSNERGAYPPALPASS